MKSTLFILLAGAGMALASCGGGTAAANNADKTAEAGHGAATYKIDVAKSGIKWTGSKVVGMGEHFGTIGLKEGSIHTEDDVITAGSFIIDMTTIKNTDLPKAEDKAMLEGHLKADDFFNVEKYPTGKFEITKVEVKADGAYTHVISGNLTLRDVTKNISIPATVDMNAAGLVATGKVTINRLDWGINYDKDKMSLSEAAQQSAKNGIVSKDIPLEINIHATK